jgi:hypothetical protein
LNVKPVSLTEEEELVCEGLINVFNKTVFLLKYIPVNQRRKAKKFLENLKVVEVEDLADKLQKNSINDSSQGSISEDVKMMEFRKIVLKDSLIPELMSKLIDLNVFRTSINKGKGTVTLFGTDSDEDFWKNIKQVLSDNQIQLPSFDVLKMILNYYGNWPKPQVTFEGTMSGQKFPFEILDDPNCIPERNLMSCGSVGGFVKDVDSGDIYAVTAAHVVSSQKIILNKKNLFRGFNEKYGCYLDVAFLKVKKDFSPFTNSLASSYDSSVYCQHWSSYNQNQLIDQFPTPLSFPPGTEIEKLGFGTGFTRGWLIDAQSNASFKATNANDQNEDLRNVIAVRSMPDRPFTFGNDSGSIYYAVQGCMRYPIAIHNGSSTYQIRHFKNSESVDLTEIASFGSNLTVAIDWWLEHNGLISNLEWF